MKCPTCESCEYEQYCGATEIMRKCERHNKKVEQTNMEWLQSMTEDELAEWIYRAMFYKSCQKDVEDGAYMQMMTKKDYIESWLREKHNEQTDSYDA